MKTLNAEKVYQAGVNRRNFGFIRIPNKRETQIPCFK